MRLLIFTSIYFFLSFSTALGQVENFKPEEIPLIERRQVLLINQYYILGQQVSLRRVAKLMKPYEDASKELKASRRWMFFAELSAGVGLGVIAAQLISAEDNDGFSFGVAGIGAGIFLLAVPLSTKADRKAVKAIDLYSVRQSMLGMNRNRLKLGLALDDKGVGLKLKF